ncbi:MAG: HEAT repeat domain-containing protein [Chloroflexi bacterium]|nr:HEAT repeat domain-containing protein [Chloroflexota bacterium]
MPERLPKMNKKEKLNFLADIEDGYRPFDKRALKMLRTLLDDHDPQVRAEAIACLWNDPDPHWIDVLIGKATNDEHSDVRAHAISALGRYIYEGDAAEFEGWDAPMFEITKVDYERVTDFLFRIAQDPDEALEMRRCAIEALAFRVEDPDVTELIEWAYQQRDRRFRASAIFAMARNGDPRWTDNILAELHSTDPEIQYEAVHAAGELGLEEATETLIQLARGKGTRKPLRLLAIYALAETGDERAYPVLDQLSHARDRDVREVARDALEEWYDIREMEELEDEPVGEAEDSLPHIWQGEGIFSKN